eukprot:5350680-Pyramimonas_sp.AAC.1
MASAQTAAVPWLPRGGCAVAVGGAVSQAGVPPVRGARRTVAGAQGKTEGSSRQQSIICKHIYTPPLGG